MKPLVAALVALVTAFTSPLLAQWPLHPVGVPKGADGKPNLTAPAPRTADGKPDLAGIWMISAGGAGTGIPGGLPYRPWAADLQKMRAAEGGLNDPDGLCLPQGLLQYHVDPQPLKIVQTPTQILIIYESNYGLRTIYMDGRSLPPLGRRSRSGTATRLGDGMAIRSSLNRTTSAASTRTRFMASSPRASMALDGSIIVAARTPKR